MSNAIYGAAGMSKTQIWAAGSKTQFYNTDGTGRDLYISLHNGGFCPPTEATKIEELGTFYYSKQRARDYLPTIHSKGVAYTNNGGGRDTYISDSAGGLRMMYQPASYKRTFYNNLRVYDNSPSPMKAPSRSIYNQSLNSLGDNTRSRSTLKVPGTIDVFLKSQLHYNDKFAREARHIRNYQKGMDERLSIPKKLVQSTKNRNKMIRNSLLNPVEVIKQREDSGERVEMSNYRKY